MRVIRVKFFFNRGYKSIIMIKNNRYFDLTSAGGTSLLGHNNNIFKKALSEFSKNNYLILLYQTNMQKD